MTDIHDIWVHPGTRSVNERRRNALLFKIPQLKKCSHIHYLSLFDYFTGLPERFYDPEVYLKYTMFWNSNASQEPTGIWEYISEGESHINRAFRLLVEINSEEWHDKLFTTLGDYEITRSIDQTINPIYLKLIEAVYFPLIHPIAYFSRKKRGVGTDGLDVYSSVEELAKTDFAFLGNFYNNVIRNGIAHAGITYFNDSIKYRDKKGNSYEISFSEMISLTNDLLDICNGMVFALKIFLLCNIDKVHRIPQQLLIRELQVETDVPWWTIEGCLDSDLGAKRQLVIYAKANSYDSRKVNYSAIQSCVLAEYYAPGYDRYFISIKSQKALPGWLAIDGNKLREVRNNEPKSLNDYSEVLKTGQLFYVPKIRIPNLLNRIVTIIDIFRSHWPIIIEEILDKLGRPKIVVRVATIHRNGWRSVITGNVLITNGDKAVDKEIVRKCCKRIIRAALLDARRNCSVLSSSKYIPLGYARIYLFQRDFRKSKLTNYGLGSDLIGTIQIKKIKRIKSPDIWGAEIEAKGNLRIAWNSLWLKKSEGFGVSGAAN